MGRIVKYPVGQQSFESLRKGGFLYVDKTRFIEEIVNGSQYYFLGRPRRFGKSLFLSTLKCFFEGKRHLFKGLYADEMDWEWEEYPVLFLDLNIEKYKTRDTLDAILLNNIINWEKEYDIKPEIDLISVRFSNVIKKAYEKTGRQVVILVDEYDKPLVNNLHDREQFEYFRDQLSSLYSNFKSSADYIKLVFLTGVSRFGKLSVFSGLNNIRDISFDKDFSAICGITETELHSDFKVGIDKISEEKGISYDDTVKMLKSYYDGYRFSSACVDIYNPFSLLHVMTTREFRNYWIQSGTPTLLLELLKSVNADLKALFNSRASIDTLIGLDFDNPRPVSLLYQTGYLTIKDVNKNGNIFRLGLPNREVKEGFLSFLLPYYSNLHGEDALFVVDDFVSEFREGNVEGFMKRLQSLFASVSYRMEMEREQNIHNALYMLMLLVGLEAKTEMATSDGRIDLFVKTDRFYYIIELKLDGSAEAALAQIKDRNYALPFACDDRQVIKIGVDFSSESRTVRGWMVERD